MKFTQAKKMKWSLDDLADWIAEFTKDGAKKGDVWDFWHWFDKRCKPPR